MDKRSFLSAKDKRILGGVEYEIQRVVGSGASTIVYEASYKDALNQESIHKVLMKELYPYDEDNLFYRDENGFLCWDSSQNKWMEDHKSFFRKGNEMNIRLLEKNPKAVSGNLNSFEAYGTYYSVLPLHGGETLEEKMKNEKICSFKEAAAILLQILDALSLFHENQMLNLDVSPDNILLLDSHAMFIDYNSVWDLNDWESDCFFSQKEGYTAPEILLQEYDEIGYVSDLYSVTAVFYQMLFGKTFDLKNRGWEKIATTVHEIMAEEVEESVEEELIHILKKGLHPLGEKRHQTIEEYRKQMEELLIRIKEAENDTRGLKVRFFAGGVLGFLCLLLSIFLAKYLVEEKPWLARIISQGNSNANLYNKARFCLADEQYEYYIDQKGNLVMCSYDEEEHAFDPTAADLVFTQNESVEGDGVDFLNLGTDEKGRANKLYYCYYGGEDHRDAIMSMNLDGSGQEVLFTQEDHEIGDYYSYARLSDGREYIYYMFGIESEEGMADDYTIWRYDLHKREEECLIDSNVQWFNVYEKHIYYIEYDYEAESYQLKRATLDGKSQKLLDEKNQFIGGFVADDHLYLERFLENEYSIQSCDLDGRILYDKEGIYGLDLSDIEIGYGDGWIYYSKEGEKELRKIRLDGTADKLIYAGMDCYGINCVGNYLFLSTAAAVDGEILTNDSITEDYLIERNGEDVLKIK